MKKRDKRRKVAATIKAHAWLGIFCSLFILLLTCSGILLNHPGILEQPLSISQSTSAFEMNPKYSYTAQDGTIFIATQSQLFHSKDFGASFHPIRFPTSTKHGVSMTESYSDYFFGLSNGVVFVADKNDLLWKRLDTPQMIELYSLSFHNNVLWVSTNNGLFKYHKNDWTIIQKNKSPFSMYDFIKALHTGYMPFSGLKLVNTLSSLLLVSVILTGIYLFFKLYIKILTEKKR